MLVYAPCRGPLVMLRPSVYDANANAVPMLLLASRCKSHVVPRMSLPAVCTPTIPIHISTCTPSFIPVSETEQPAPPLPKRIHEDRAQEQPNTDPDRDLDHAISHVEHDGVQFRSRLRRSLFVHTSAYIPYTKRP
jgi:hypothetical protein